ncbi:phage tail assembly chaperone [Burkholderia vietnamiensis]|uniref:phage tail assembly chaperone n=1 Tax=Burkholderia vietnamiensis TaxID=60552 RepID=UPI001CF23AF8|nr:phage tail assembly chaperone [Burkholderia vietnamiensis]MCA8198882.1 phage tail assembly chaperone [Burkholderia vietnamiensis]
MGQKFAAFDTQGKITAFYDSVDSPPPAAAKVVEICDDEWRTAIEAPSRGKRATLDEGMRVVLVDPPAPTRVEIAAAKRAARDAALHATDWLVSRHQEEKLLGKGTTLAADQFAALIIYRQALRDIADAGRWPDVELPTAPDFAAAIN